MNRIASVAMMVLGGGLFSYLQTQPPPTQTPFQISDYPISQFSNYPIQVSVVSEADQVGQ